jgi:hypothetical protein
MNTTTTPGFTAEASLYDTSRHYRTSYRALDLAGHTAGTIRPSEIDVPGEVIEIEDDAPWSPPPWGGHTGPGTTGGGGETGSGEPGGGGGDGGTPSKTDPNDKPQPGLHGCSPNQIMSDAAKPCQDKVESDLMNHVTNPHYTRCMGKRHGNVMHPKMECCQKQGNRTVCEPL